VALMRSIESKAKVMLWDDPFSSMDVLIEKRIMDYMKELVVKENILLIISSHRLSLAKNCDQIIFVNALREVGLYNKEDITEKHELKEFFKTQFAEFSLS
jgi:ATP-binding cassette subfamily B protein